MPTHEQALRFLAEHARLSPAQQAVFLRAVVLFREGLKSGSFHPRLRVKGFKSEPGVFEMTWARDGRALWMYGDPLPGKPGPHIIWLRIGTHDIFER
ncbi:hypothetical protein [Protofrankia symbiont of Coriaria ruscifolia]|uniref:hypothetical protein n=1 Tax=Protofrankia symbiont of Coriaria ruscifolia TaxID=1306542 RepID=UPI001041472E|nr:hypothetical protein [Protofrankia symbiont of Coriaria ruscifolia]